MSIYFVSVRILVVVYGLSCLEIIAKLTDLYVFQSAES